MKTQTRTMIVFVAVNLIAAGSAFTGNVAVEGTPPGEGKLLKPESAPRQQNAFASYNSRLSGLSLRGELLGSRLGGSTGAVLVIPSTEIATEEIATITEDMSIMSRILEKNLQQAHIDVDNMFISNSDPFHLTFSRGKPPTQGMFLQGYGALFLMKVDFPLSPGPKSEEEQEIQQKDEQDVDPVWTQMKQDMFEPEKPRKEKPERPKKEYDAGKVDNLKTTLIKTLKHAANIRSLKPDESVILSITGSGTSSGIKNMRTIPETGQVIVIDEDNNTRIIQKGLPVVDIGLSLPTVLVIRVKKSDIDRFAKGDLDFDQFQQNIQILMCAYIADQSGSGDPFTGYYYKINR